METKETTSQKAKSWKFDFNILSEDDKEFCLRKFHGEWYDKMSDEDKFDNSAMAYIELNALIANELLKRGTEPFVNGKGENFNLLTVFSHLDLEVPVRVIDNYLMVDGESDYETVGRDENQDVQERLKKYKFWS